MAVLGRLEAPIGLIEAKEPVCAPLLAAHPALTFCCRSRLSVSELPAERAQPTEYAALTG